jgi:hypothetical protein
VAGFAFGGRVCVSMSVLFLLILHKQYFSNMFQCFHFSVFSQCILLNIITDLEPC